VDADTSKATVWDQLRQRDLRAFAPILTPERIAHAAWRIGRTVGTSPLNLGNLVWLAVACAWHKGRSFASVLTLFVKILRDAPDWVGSPLQRLQQQGLARARGRSQHDPRGHDPCALSEEAFVQARAQFPPWLFDSLLCLLVADFERAYPQYVRYRGFRLLALDGTTVALPGWQRLAAHFGTQDNGRGRRNPAARMVMLQLPRARLPWRYALTPLADGERAVAARLLDRLGPDDLVLMDKGFFSYGLFWQIQGQGACFATRLKAGVKLQTVRELGPHDRLVRWRPVDRRKHWKHLPAEMALRVIDYHVPGFRPSAVLTNVLDPGRVSGADWVRLAAVDEAGRVIEPGLYHRRWEIETSFCELKVTQGLEGSLRSRTPEGVAYEVGGHVLLYLLVRWLLAESAQQAGLSDPLRLSFQGALGELDDLWQSLLVASPEHAQQVLRPRLLERLASHRVPLRPGRSYPRPRDGKPKDKGKRRTQKAAEQQKAKGHAQKTAKQNKGAA
jgi:hypothetical protein